MKKRSKLNKKEKRLETNRDVLLAKAKRTDTGEWIKGFYFCMVHDDGRHVHHFIIPLGVDLSLGTSIENIQVEVDPETVCTYIGVNDRDGKEIFTRCILRMEIRELMIVVIGEVVLNKSWCAGFCLRVVDEEGISYYQIECEPYDEETICNNSEIIGNIFDNPELLEKNPISPE